MARILRAGSQLLGGGRAPWYRAGGAPLPVAAWQPKGAASQAASYENLANPGQNPLTVNGSVSWNASEGWIFPTATYLLTNINLTADHSVIVRFSNAAAALEIFGCFGAGLTYQCTINASGVQYRLGSAPTVPPSMSAGVIGMTKTGGYRNGALDAAITSASGSSSVPMSIHGRNNAGTVQGTAGLKIQAVAIYSTTLTAAQVAAVSAAMAAL